MTESNDKLIYATSFSPEYCTELDIKQPMKVLDFILDDLCIRDIRLGLRWSRVVNRQDKLNLKGYAPYLDRVLKSPNSKLTLNVGPIKTFRWPEVFIPDSVDVKGLLNRENIIIGNSDIAKHSIDYFEKLLILLKQNYGKQLDNITFQVENESFNRFGTHKLKMDEKYLVKILKILKGSFPKSSLMVNSAGRMNLSEIIKLFENLKQQNIYNMKELVLGFNLYFRLPHTLPFIQKFNPLIISKPWDMNIRKLHEYKQKYGFGLEISEGQFEQWQSQKTPGNSVEDWEYLLKLSNDFFPKNYPSKVLRIWGLERFARHFINGTETAEHREIRRQIIGDML